jgi:hypothetical protein
MDCTWVLNLDLTNETTSSYVRFQVLTAASMMDIVLTAILLNSKSLNIFFQDDRK